MARAVVAAGADGLIVEVLVEQEQKPAMVWRSPGRGSPVISHEAASKRPSSQSHKLATWDTFSDGQV